MMIVSNMFIHAAIYLLTTAVFVCVVFGVSMWVGNNRQFNKELNEFRRLLPHANGGQYTLVIIPLSRIRRFEHGNSRRVFKLSKTLFKSCQRYKLYITDKDGVVLLHRHRYCDVWLIPPDNFDR